LLEKTDLPDEAADYVKILGRKSEKLREIVYDVFSLAKATSGVEIEREDIDFAILLRQVLADNYDKTENSDKVLKTDISVDDAPITGDGAKLYRVIQNLLDNAFKYSLDGTRIYFTLTENGDEYELTAKNVSAYEMNFTAEEITERFTRGDKSRSDGGSGLGLSIAKSFTEACGGSFEIEIDGDVFKAIVRFKKRETLPDDSKTELTEIQ
jgi:signal transduction histidine kinase